MTTSMQLIPFHGDELIYVEIDGAPYVALKPICGRLGLDWKAQHKRLSPERERWGMVIRTIPSPGGEQETTCIPVNRIAMWLASIQTSKVKPELREALIRYQTEAADVLDRHFRLKRDEDALEIADLKAALARCHRHLMIAKPKWAAMREATAIGMSDYGIARMARLSLSAMDEDRDEMRHCGLLSVGTWHDGAPRSSLERIEQLEFELKLARLRTREAEIGTAEARKEWRQGKLDLAGRDAAAADAMEARNA